MNTQEHNKKVKASNHCSCCVSMLLDGNCNFLLLIRHAMQTWCRSYCSHGLAPSLFGGIVPLHLPVTRCWPVQLHTSPRVSDQPPGTDTFHAQQTCTGMPARLNAESCRTPASQQLRPQCPAPLSAAEHWAPASHPPAGKPVNMSNLSIGTKCSSYQILQQKEGANTSCTSRAQDTLLSDAIRDHVNPACSSTLAFHLQQGSP